MFKKVALGIIAGSLVLAAQAASADSQQFLIDGRYRDVSEVRTVTVPSGAEAVRTVAPTQAQLERLQASGNFPAPYSMSGGYFN